MIDAAKRASPSGSPPCALLRYSRQDARRRAASRSREAGGRHALGGRRRPDPRSAPLRVVSVDLHSATDPGFFDDPLRSHLNHSPQPVMVALPAQRHLTGTRSMWCPAARASDRKWPSGFSQHLTATSPSEQRPRQRRRHTRWSAPRAWTTRGQYMPWLIRHMIDHRPAPSWPPRPCWPNPGAPRCVMATHACSRSGVDRLKNSRLTKRGRHNTLRPPGPRFDKLEVPPEPGLIPECHRRRVHEDTGCPRSSAGERTPA